ncbi:hypothetical protein GO755_39725 [Spirosoma sp. HMF4905]|uniref:Uncharacterized protein n=1 Tax=Spirosoma arboris TaxID=2682092 RepID=A0A7K1SQZ9_9BACT|nr:hypothetical protein [Spirosoma arboris]MVM36207.1 hypothetical protein [Spirosoma arboris]
MPKLIVSCFIGFEVLLDMDLTYFLLILIGLIIGLTPPVFRLARLTWINFFVSFDPNKPTHCPYWSRSIPASMRQPL